MDDIVAYVESLKVEGYIPRHRVDSPDDTVAVGRVRLYYPVPTDTEELPDTESYSGPTEAQVSHWNEHNDHVWPPEDYS